MLPGVGPERFSHRARFLNGEGYRGNPNQAPKLDVSGIFPDGKKFETLEEYKAGLMTQKDKFARAFRTPRLIPPISPIAKNFNKGFIIDILVA